ncbi:MAG: gfo/Idh/MocA family oxidoreductase [Planctomycetia bacterium]|nr:gfo/Idh/MocA family oxidoreductase [Planctomycetia bacterium]
MVRIGIAGIGFMGRIHFLAASRLANGRVTAICSRDPAKRAGDWTSTRGNFGPEPGRVELTGVKPYASYDELLGDPTIDLVDICTVTDQHAPMALAALRAGKHVLVEKAISLTEAEADQMVATARAAGKLLMVAHVLPFFPEFKFAANAVRSGVHGKLLSGHLTRVISRPDWSGDIGDAGKTGGPAVDLHIHDTHFVGLIGGRPKAVSSSGVVSNGVVEYLTTNYHYGFGGPALSCSSGAVAMSGRAFVHGYELYLERATLSYSSAGLPVTVFTPDGKSHQPNLGSGDAIDAFAEEIGAAVEAVRTGHEADMLSPGLARDALVMCFREIESVKTGKEVNL